MNNNVEPEIDPIKPSQPDTNPAPLIPDIPRRLPEEPNDPNTTPVEVPPGAPIEIPVIEPDVPNSTNLRDE